MVFPKLHQSSRISSINFCFVHAAEPDQPVRHPCPVIFCQLTVKFSCAGNVNIQGIFVGSYRLGHIYIGTGFKEVAVTNHCQWVSPHKHWIEDNSQQNDGKDNKTNQETGERKTCLIVFSIPFPSLILLSRFDTRVNNTVDNLYKQVGKQNHDCNDQGTCRNQWVILSGDSRKEC